MGNIPSAVTSPHVKSNDHILRLSESINSNSRLPRSRLNLQRIEASSIRFDRSLEFPASAAGPEATATRHELIAQTKQLHDLLVGPSQRVKAMVMEVSCSFYFTQDRLLTDTRSPVSSRFKPSAISKSQAVCPEIDLYRTKISPLPSTKSRVCRSTATV